MSNRTASRIPDGSVFAADGDRIFQKNSNESVVSLWGHQGYSLQRNLVVHDDSAWSAQLREKLNALTALPIGWDGYHGVPVSFDCARFAVRILDAICDGAVPAPSLVPGSDGTLQIEWHCCGFDVELDVLDVGQVDAYRLNRGTGEEEEIELGVDFTQISTWIEDMAARS